MNELPANESLAFRIVAAGARSVVWLFGQGGRVREWRAVARRCGLTNLRDVRTLGVTHRLEGDADFLHVVFTSAPPRDSDDPRGNIRIHGLAAGLYGPAEARHRLGGFDVPMGAAVPPLGGPPLLLCALLHAPARQLVTGLFEGRVEGDDGTERAWSCKVRLAGGALSIDYDGELFDAALQGALNAALCLAPTDDATRAAAGNLRQEKSSGLRAFILRTLAEEAPDHPATSAAVREGLTDAAPAIRLEAALASGAEGRAVLRALTTSEDTNEATLARAISALGAALPTDDLRELLRRTVARRRIRAAIACLELLGTRGPAVADALVRALRSPDPGVVIAAAQALARHADTREAVIALREAATLGRGDPDLVKAVRHAVSAIQPRLERAAAGQLSVAGDGEGALALVEDAHGRVALEPRQGADDPKT
ncbi:MAG: hypothetical protein ABW221_00740 [Vicinamibacteria bacterium]